RHAGALVRARDRRPSGRLPRRPGTQRGRDPVRSGRAGRPAGRARAGARRRPGRARRAGAALRALALLGRDRAPASRRLRLRPRAHGARPAGRNAGGTRPLVGLTGGETGWISSTTTTGTGPSSPRATSIGTGSR